MSSVSRWYVEMKDSNGFWRQVQSFSEEGHAEQRMKYLKRHNPETEFRVYEFNRDKMVADVIAYEAEKRRNP